MRTMKDVLFRRLRMVGLLAVFAALAQCLAQTPPIAIYENTPNTRAITQGTSTVEEYRLSEGERAVIKAGSEPRLNLLLLPARKRSVAPKLLGMIRHGGEVEVFLGWTELSQGDDPSRNHLEIFRGKTGDAGKLVRDFEFDGGPAINVEFFEPPEKRDTPVVLLDVMGGSYWGVSYFLAPDRQSVEKLFSSSDHEFADLNRDGVHELIAWNRRPWDVRCGFGIFRVRFYPEVFVRSGIGYSRIWPPQDWASPDGELERRFRAKEKEGVPWNANLEMMGAFADLNGDGAAELVVLQDRMTVSPAQSLAVYRMQGKSMRQVAQLALPTQRVAYLLSDIRHTAQGPEIAVRTATPEKCNAGITADDPGPEREIPGTTESVYLFRNGGLQAVGASSHH